MIGPTFVEVKFKNFDNILPEEIICIVNKWTLHYGSIHPSHGQRAEDTWDHDSYITGERDRKDLEKKWIY